jgi:hypothetical protein
MRAQLFCLGVARLLSLFILPEKSVEQLGVMQLFPAGQTKITVMALTAKLLLTTTSATDGRLFQTLA